MICKEAVVAYHTNTAGHLSCLEILNTADFLAEIRNKNLRNMEATAIPLLGVMPCSLVDIHQRFIQI
jgi:hypothetical protein